MHGKLLYNLFSDEDKVQAREEEKLRKMSDEYLMVNFPAGIRKNLKGIILPEKEDASKRKMQESENVNDGKNVTNTASTSEGNHSIGRVGCA